MRITAEFVTSAAGAGDFPADGLAEVAFVGRSNVGKSSLLNALTRQRLARTSAAPGKTRLANIYRVRRGAGGPLYLVDLPGYGYARGGETSAREFQALTQAYFTGGRRGRESTLEAEAERSRDEARGWGPAQLKKAGAPPPVEKKLAAVLLVDSRHPGLESDLQAWDWLRDTVAEAAVVATKIDKLARGERIRAMRELESVFEDSVLPVSAVTGEGLDELWKLIDRLANSRNNPQPPRRNNRHRLSPPARAMAPRRRRN